MGVLRAVLTHRTCLPLEDLGDDLGAVLDAVGSERAVVMASWESGMVAQVFAAAHPERVSSLILLDSWVSIASTKDTPWMPDRRWWESMFETYERRWGRDWDVNGSARRAGGDGGGRLVRAHAAGVVHSDDDDRGGAPLPGK